MSHFKWLRIKWLKIILWKFKTRCFLSHKAKHFAKLYGCKSTLHSIWIRFRNSILWWSPYASWLYCLFTWKCSLLTKLYIKPDFQFIQFHLYKLYIDIKDSMSIRLHRCWWRMLETICVGDDDKIFVTVLILPVLDFNTNIHYLFT